MNKAAILTKDDPGQPGATSIVSTLPNDAASITASGLPAVALVRFIITLEKWCWVEVRADGETFDTIDARHVNVATGIVKAHGCKGITFVPSEGNVLRGSRVWHD